MDINWSLAGNGGNNALAAFQQGAKIGDEIRRRRALSAFTQSPNDPASLNALIAADPATGFKAAEFQREQTKAQREQEYGSAVGDYMSSGEGAALVGGGAVPSGRVASAPTRSLVPGPLNGKNALSTFTEPQGHWPSPDQAPQLPDSRSTTPDPDLAVLGAPRTGADHAFLRMVKADPIKAMKFRSDLRDNFVKNLKDTREFYRFGVERLAQASDEASYQAVLTELQPMAQAVGGNILDHVPANYPGSEGIRGLLTKALDAKEQVSTFMQQANIDDDNERADRNTDSVIADRSARRGETRRNNDQRDRTTRRGQDNRGSGRSGLVTVKTRAEAEALPSGTKFRDPNGIVRTRP